MALYVKKITRKELADAWGFDSFPSRSDSFFIRCKKNGDINFDTASVYQPQELVGRNNVTVLN